MANLGQDFRFGLRVLRKSPGFTLVAVAALALGIGANATVFTIANGFLFRNLPFADSRRIFYISGVHNSDGRGSGESYPDYSDFQSQVKSFEVLGALARFDVDISDAWSLPSQYKGARVTANAFSAIGQHPAAGRDFVAADGLPGAPPVAILAHALWQSRYHAEPEAIGSTIRVNEVPTVVVGVMPPGLRFPGDSSLWIPLVPAGDWTRREYRSLTMFGRLADGATVSSARAEMTAIARRLETQYPGTDRDTGARVQSFNDYFIGQDTRLVLLALLGAVGFVLLIACANVVNLLLARAVLRAREVSIRAALGAGRWRVIRQLLVESTLLCLAGGALGAVMGIWGVRLFQQTILPNERAAYLSFPLDYHVLAYLTAITFGTAILAGFAPALRLARVDINECLKEGARSSGTGHGGRRLTTALITFEVALAFVLLVGAGLMIRSFLKMARTPIGARTDHLMTMDILLRPNRYPAGASQVSFYDQLLERLRALPGVAGAGMASNLPGDGWMDFQYEREGAPPVDPQRNPQTGGVIVSPGYFAVLGIRPVRGRVFTDRDGMEEPPVLVVNQSFAKAAWPGQDPVGRRLRLTRRSSRDRSGSTAAQPWLTVVGLIPDIVQNDESQGLHDPLLYLPYRQMPQREMVLAARTPAPPGFLANDFRRAVQALDADLPVTDLRTLDQLLWERTWKWRVYGSMFSLFAGMALLLASVGLYSSIAHSMNQRIQEIGVRMALGATRQDILWMVLANGVQQVLIGLAVGLAASLAVAQVLDSMLVGVSPADPLTLAAVGLVLALAGISGSTVPAMRATRIDPAVALRHE
ncbi:MAG: ABC transporter permease [Candidatus Sulfopaludibacter sp.]|nr:ABC transporter permease [Candidatus Sulfopaludibacter sp.]